MSLFSAILIELYDELQTAGCGIKLVDICGKSILISMVAFVDDIAEEQKNHCSFEVLS